ncbi:hypothetical protein Tco_1360683 [Tanacetum coccineum]
MASFDYRLNPLYAIKECSSCGALYTADFCCSKGGLEDKILVPKSPQNCATCGDPVDGLYCRPCAFVRKCLNEGWYTIHDENEILNTSESSNDNTNIVSAPQEPFVFNQDPGQNSSRSPPHIDHHCCYECGDSLNDIFCQRCTCKSCGKGAHYGYNCPPQIPIISNPEPCYNQNLNEILQNLQSLQQQCLLGTCQQCGCNEYDGVCFYCTVGNGTPINFSTPYSSNDSPSFANHPPQPQYVSYSCELCGNESHYGYDCLPQVPFVYNQDPCFNQNFDYFSQTLPSFPQQYPCCEYCGGRHETFQCQPMNYYEPNPCYNSNYFGFDQTQPLQYTVNHTIFNTQNEFLNSQNKLMEQMTSICDMVGQYMQKKEEDRRIAEEQVAKDRYWKIPICYDDDEDYTIAITPVLSTKEPVDSLIMEDEHLDNILATKSDEVIKSSVEILVPIPSEFEGISDDTCDVPVRDDPSIFDVLSDHSKILSDSNDDDTSSDNDDFEDVEYVSLEEVNNVDQEEKEFDLEDILQIQDTFSDHTEETRSDSTTTHANNSLPEYDSFLFEIEPDQGGLTSDNSNDPLLELPEFESFHFDLYDDPSFPRPPPIPPGIKCNFDPGGGEINFSQNVNDDDSFKFVIQTFLSILTYLADSPLLLSTGSEDTIFDPCIST